MSDTIAHTEDGTLIEVRCNLTGCPQPVIGVYLAGLYHEGSESWASEMHLWRHHILPQRMRDSEETINALPSPLEALVPGISAVMAEHGLRFKWEKA